MAKILKLNVLSRDISLPRLFFITVFAITFISLFILSLFQFRSIRGHYKNIMEISSDSFMERKKSELRSEVGKVIFYINRQREYAEEHDLSEPGTDAEDHLRSQILQHIGRIRFGIDGYIFVMTYDGTVIMNDVQPYLMGKNIWDMEDPDGVKVVQEERRAAEAENGDFILYRWEKPDSDEPVRKLSFIHGDPEWEWIIGAGLYLDDLDRELDLIREAYIVEIRRTAVTALLLILLLVFAILYAAMGITRRVRRNLNSFMDFFSGGGERKIRIDEMFFREFRLIAGYVNDLDLDRLAAKAESADADRRLRLFTDAALEIFIRTDADLNILDINKAGVQFIRTELSRSEVIGKNISEFTDADFLLPGRVNHYNRVLQTGNPMVVDEIYTAREGVGKVLTFSIFKVGEDLGFIITDITEKKKAESVLKESERKQRHLLGNIRDVLLIVDENGNIGYASPNSRMQLNYDSEELCDRSIFDLMQEEDAVLFRKTLGDLNDRSGGRKLAEFQLKGGDGSLRTVEMQCVNFLDDPVIGGLLISIRDISARREAEIKYKLAFKSSPDAVNINRVNDGMYIEVNEGFTRLTGYTEEDVRDRTSAEINIWVDPSDREKLVKGLQKNGYYDNLEARFRRKDGSETTALMSARIIEVNGEKAILSITRDIEQLKQSEKERQILEENLRQTQKLEGIGQLAGGIAHDFNNILAALYGFTELALEESNPSDPVYEALIQIQKVNERAKNLVSQLLAFSRKQAFEPRILSVNEKISELNKMLLRLIGEDISIKIHLTDANPMIMADPSQLEQLLINLVVNARDAIREFGDSKRESKIFVSTEVLDTEAVKKADIPTEINVPCVVISVSDSGIGMDEEQLKKIFEPFYTTKKEGQGTGLGLSTVFGIVSQNRGVVVPESVIGKGSTFRIYWPLTEAMDDDTAEETAEEAPAVGEGTILYAEDDELVREITELILSSRGYTVISCVNGEEAFRKAEELNWEFDLLMTDVTMPKLGGWDLFKKIQVYKPGVPVLFCSGYNDNTSFLEKIADREYPYLSKPFRSEDLTRMVRSILKG